MKRFLTLRALAWTLASLITLYFLAVALENWTGARALAAAKARVAQEGETLDFHALLAKPPPDNVNFGALPPLAGITNPKNKPPQALEALNWSKTHPKVKAPNAIASISTGKPAELKAWIDYLAQLGIGKTGATPAEAFAALDAAHPALKQLADAAPARREAQFTPLLGEGQHPLPFFEIQLPHYALVQPLARALALRAHLAIASSNTTEAVHTLQAGLRLVNAANAEPLLISVLVGISQHAAFQEAMWSLIQSKTVSEADLSTLLADLQRLDFHAALLQAMRGELAGCTQSLETLKHRTGRLAILDNSGQSAGPSWLTQCVDAIIPSGFMDHSAARIIDTELARLIVPMKKGLPVAVMAQVREIDRELMARHRLLDPHGILLVLVVPAYRQILSSTEHAEALRRVSITAILIERHRLAQGKLPASLSEVATAPRDPIDDQPLRYRVEGEHYQLWSIGIDNHDDQGRADEKAAKKPAAADFTGDWVWRSSPAP